MSMATTHERIIAGQVFLGDTVIHDTYTTFHRCVFFGQVTVLGKGNVLSYCNIMQPVRKGRRYIDCTPELRLRRN